MFSNSRYNNSLVNTFSICNHYSEIYETTQKKCYFNFLCLLIDGWIC